MDWATFQQVIRIFMGWLSAYLVTKGMLTAELATTLTGSATGLVQVLWWLYWEKNRPA